MMKSVLDAEYTVQDEHIMLFNTFDMLTVVKSKYESQNMFAWMQLPPNYSTTKPKGDEKSNNYLVVSVLSVWHSPIYRVEVNYPRVAYIVAYRFFVDLGHTVSFTIYEHMMRLFISSTDLRESVNL